MPFAEPSTPLILPQSSLPLHTPEYWVKRLNKTLDDRRPALDMYESYYSGDHPLPVAPKQAADAFRRLLRQSRSNWMALVVDAVKERLTVEGFRYGADGSGDRQAWKIWQANGLDVGSKSVHLEALKTGESAVSVEPNPDDPRYPLIHPETPGQVVVATDPGRRRVRLAAFKRWLDDSGYLFATLYLPDAIYKLRSDQPSKIGLTHATKWVRRYVDGEEWPLPNPLGEVAVVPFCNNPRLGFGGVSEIESLIDIQDRINKTLFDRMMAAEFSAFRQKWVTGMDIPVDEATGQQLEPFQAAVDRIWMSENPETKFGEFTETSLAGYIGSVEADIQHLAAISRTPPHYLLGQSGAIPSGESLKSTETGLVAKVNERTVHFGESWEEVMRLAFKFTGSRKGDVTDSETIWRNPESRTLGELTDSLLKMRTLGVPVKALWVEWGVSPQKITQWEAWAAEEKAAGLAPSPALQNPADVTSADAMPPAA